MNESPSLRLIMQKGICDLLVHLGSAGLEDELVCVFYPMYNAQVSCFVQFKKGIDHLMTAKFTEAEEEILCLGLGKLLVGRSIADKKVGLSTLEMLSANIFFSISFTWPKNTSYLPMKALSSPYSVSSTRSVSLGQKTRLVWRRSVSGLHVEMSSPI